MMMIMIVYKSGKSDNIITEESLTNDNVSNRKNKKQKNCITNRKHKKKHNPRRTTHSQTITDVKILKLLAEQKNHQGSS